MAPKQQQRPQADILRTLVLSAVMIAAVTLLAIIVARHLDNTTVLLTALATWTTFAAALWVAKH